MATVDPNTFLMQPIVVPATSGMTLGGFRSWLYSSDFPEHGRVTFVNGRLIIEMSPERIDSHVKVKGEIYRVIIGIVKDLNLGEFYADGARITKEEADVSNEPDASFASWETLSSGRLTPPQDRPQDGNHIEMVGAPDWVCEILSDSSIDKDTRQLMQAYHKAGVREYWLIDARGKNIKFKILIWEPEKFNQVEPRDGWHASLVFGREFQLTRSRNQIGRWDYELRQRRVGSE
jgi:Uma2 family endonuclease